MKKKKKYPLKVSGLKIDPIIFEQGFVPFCNIPICNGECCNWGVYVDIRFKEDIMKYEKEIIETMDDGQIKDSSKWFESKKIKDSDFPSGYAIGTQLYVNKNLHRKQCVFKDSQNYCTLQKTSVRLGLHKWALKPKYCIMYPLTIVNDVLTYDKEHSERLSYCGLHKKKNFVHTVFEAFTEELIYILGQEGYNILKEYFEDNYKKDGKV